jgi:hypothetical protein
MKKNFLAAAIIAAIFISTIVSCKKENVLTNDLPVMPSNVKADTPYLSTVNIADTPYLSNAVKLDTPYLPAAYADTPYLRK